ncbi:alpha/beta hydrolase, partial [Lactobacillus sp. XV13L]|nr:alpha/beta hydrolase [Lactobacillus sp. XV13L]
MNIKTIKLYYDDEYDYPSKTDFIPFMRCYLHEDNKDHPAMIIVPGGAYRLVSASEGELPALKFYKYNFNVFVCVYTTNFFQEIPLRSQPLEDLSRAVRIIRLNAKNWNILP